MKDLRILTTTLALTIAIGYCSQAQAQAQKIPTVAQNAAQTNIQAQSPIIVQSNYPPGYIALILDLEGVQLRMGLEQRNGKGDHWPSWMRPGLVEGDSLYWWLLAQWHHNAGNQDLAYKTLLTAWVLMRMETRICTVRESQLKTRTLRKYEPILSAGTTTNKAKQESLLFALNTGKKMIEHSTPLRGMACNIEPAKRAIEDQKRQLEKWQIAAQRAVNDGRVPPTWRPAKSRKMIDYRAGTTREEQKNISSIQMKELIKVEREMRGNKAWEVADINTIMRTMDGANKDP